MPPAPASSIPEQPHLQQEQRVPRSLPPPAGPAGREPGPEAWHVSGCHHQFGSWHKKPLQWLSRGCWHLWAQNIPEPKSTASDRCWGLPDPRRDCGNGIWYPLTSFLGAHNPFSGQLIFWYRVRTSPSYHPSLARKYIRVQVNIWVCYYR